jgi:hypothetical protein
MVNFESSKEKRASGVALVTRSGAAGTADPNPTSTSRARRRS